MMTGAISQGASSQAILASAGDEENRQWKIMPGLGSFDGRIDRYDAGLHNAFTPRRNSCVSSMGGGVRTAGNGSSVPAEPGETMSARFLQSGESFFSLQNTNSKILIGLRWTRNCAIGM
jgi:hypothetical protein